MTSGRWATPELAYPGSGAPRNCDKNGHEVKPHTSAGYSLFDIFFKKSSIFRENFEKRFLGQISRFF